MRLITPADAAISPDGSGGGNPATVVAVSSTTIQTITADVVVPAFEIGPLPDTGPYIIALYAIITNTTAATGALSASVTVDGGPAASIVQALTPAAAAHDIVFIGPFGVSTLLQWDVSGFTTGSADIKIIASATKLFR